MSTHLRGRVRLGGHLRNGRPWWLIEVVNKSTGKVVHSDNMCNLSACCDAARENTGGPCGVGHGPQDARHQGRVGGVMTAPACDLPDCGDIRCDRCDERMTCLGPEPRPCGLTCADCPCDCGPCGEAAQDREDERRYEIQRDERWSR